MNNAQATKHQRTMLSPQARSKGEPEYQVQAFRDGTILEHDPITGMMHSTFPGGTRVSTDIAGRIAELRLPGNRQRTFEYNDQGELHRMQALDGSHWQSSDGLTWFCEERLVYWQGKIVIGPDGTYCQQDGRTGHTRTTKIDGSIVVHSSEGRLLKQEFANGCTAEFLFDKAKRRTGTMVKDSTGTITKYDACGRIIRADMPSGRIIWFDRDLTGEIVKIRESSGVTWIRHEENLYSTSNRQRKIKAKLEIETTGRYIFHLLEPASRQFVSIACNPDGSVSRLRSDRSESLRAMPDGSTLMFNEYGQISTIIDSYKVKRTIRYDNNQLVEIVNSNGSIWFRAATGGWIIAGKSNEYANEVELDSTGNLSVKRSNGELSIFRLEGGTFHFDILRRLSSVEYGGKTTWNFKYSQSNELIQVRNQAGELWQKDGKYWRSASNLRWHESRAVEGLVYIEKSADGTTRRHLEDGSIEVTTLGSSYSTEFQSLDGRTLVKNKHGQIVRIVEPNGTIKVFQYDASGLPIAK